MKDSLISIHKAIVKIVKELPEDQLNKESYIELRKISNYINKHVPPIDSITDLNYLKYNECACCGAYPPPADGYNLLLYPGTRYLWYPICTDCEENYGHPLLERIAKMYAKYALNLDDAFIKLLNGDV